MKEIMTQNNLKKFNDISKGNLGVLFNSQNRFKRIREIND